MRLNSLFFLLREAASGLVRHRLMALAAVSTSAICFTVMGAFLASLFTLHAITAKFTSELGVMVFMDTKADRGASERACEQIRELPGVARVDLVTKEQAWARIKKDLSHLRLEGITGNPLGDELHVMLRDVDHITPVSRAVSKMPGVAEVNVMRDVVQRVEATERLLKQLGAGAAVLLLLATLSVISNVIRLTVFARRREIRIMQLVGATNAFIRMPFLLEGLLCGAVGAGIAAAVVYYGGESLLQFSHQKLPFLPLSAAALPARPLALSLVGTGALTGLLGSAASVHKFLKA